jgi:hypothetical protein
MKSIIQSLSVHLCRWSAFALVFSALFAKGTVVSPRIPQTYSTVKPVQHVIISDEQVFPSLEWFENSLNASGSFANVSADQVIGVYVPYVLALPVVQQPQDQPYFVSTDPGVVTQFRMALQSGTVGLLAHNTLAGSQFSGLALQQQVSVIYGDGSVKLAQINTIKRYQALQPENPYSLFVDLDSPGKTISSSDVFQQVFAQGNQVVFQTCIDRDGNPSWGRLFVIATLAQ